MQFSSNIFLLAFLPVVVILHFILPAKFRNYLLLVASLFFYAWGDPIYILLMLFSIVINWSFGLLLEKVSRLFEPPTEHELPGLTILRP